MSGQAESPEEYGEYSFESVATWHRIADRQLVRDTVYWPALARYLRPGSVLELGSATGQVTKLLGGLGFQAVGSDYFPFFVEDMRKQGLEAYQIDATNIQASQIGNRQFDNVVAQSLSPQLRRNREVTDAVYRSVRSALKPGGRFLFTAALYPFWPHKAKLYYSFNEHLENVQRQGGFRLVKRFPYQWVPNILYRHWNKHLLHLIDYRLARFRSMRGVFVLEKT